MLVNVANPIYDTVFKYLMEDERIARTILSALLRKEVVEVEMRPHEYSNVARDGISMFRIDFGAKVREADGNVHLVLVELQKTWVETETLRFRQYLAAQYANPHNMVREEPVGGYAIPMVTIYLLGHRVGDIEEPVVYVSHDARDYYDRPVTKGIPDPFIDSLVHDSIIVQIPRLRGQVNNRLDLVLSLFDQSQRIGVNHQMLRIDESKYDNDTDMARIIHRLLAAASDHELRQEMNVEDEYFKAIEDRDTAIMNRERTIKERDKQISEQNAQIKEKNVQISEKNAQIKELDEQLSQLDEQLSQKDEQLSQKDLLIQQQQNAILTMARSMIERGMSIEDIAAIMNKPVAEIHALLN